MGKPKTIFVVTEGEYSDYGIRAMFSTKPLAEAYIQANGGDIEEWQLDECAGWIPRTHFRARIRVSDGAIVQEWDYKSTADPHKRSDEVMEHGQDFLCSTSLISAEHARKLAVEARQKALRVGA